MREPEVERAWLFVFGACWRFEIEVDRFIADAGIGIAEALWLTVPRVCRDRPVSISSNRRLVCHVTDLSWPAHREHAGLLRHCCALL